MAGEFIRFLGAGGVNTIVSYLFYILLLYFFDYTAAYTLAYIFGIGLSYYLNLKFVFGEKSSAKKMLSFPLVYLFQYLFAMFILYIAINRFSVPEALAPIFAIMLGIPLTFYLTKTILTERKNG